MQLVPMWISHICRSLDVYSNEVVSLYRRCIGVLFSLIKFAKALSHQAKEEKYNKQLNTAYVKKNFF